MPTCEMCGEEASLKKTRVEGTTLDLCEDCREVGDVVETPSRSTSRSRTSRSSPSPSTGPDLAPDYGSRVRTAREDADMTMQELADRIKEKQSVVKRIENESLRPDQSLARKVERALDIDLYEDVSGTGVSTETEPQGEATIGDVADVEKQD